VTDAPVSGTVMSEVCQILEFNPVSHLKLLDVALVDGHRRLRET
jgi:hypothetical protein